MRHTGGKTFAGDIIKTNGKRMMGIGNSGLPCIEGGTEMRKNMGERNGRTKESPKRARRKERRIKRRMLFILRMVALAAILLHIREIEGELKQIQVVLKRIEVPQYEDSEVVEEDSKEADYVSSIGIVNVERPVQRTWTQTLSRLDSLGQSNPVIARISEESNRYPERMLVALANNPEMAGYVAGYLSDGGRLTGRLTEAEKSQPFPLLLQWDPRWGYQSYGDDSYVGVSGCGPTCLSMVLYYLTGDESLTPDKIADYAIKNSYYVEGTGTAWALMKDFPRFYGIRVTQPKITEDALKAELDAGHMLICAMSEGEFTTAGHFIVIYGYDDAGLKVNDPNCVARSRKRWDFDEIGWQVKSVWAMSG